MELNEQRLQPKYIGGREDFRKWMAEFSGCYLEIGCGRGEMLAALKQEGRIHDLCVGVELDSDARERACKVFDTVHTEPVELIIDLLPKAGCLVLADVLEHLENPWFMLQQLQSKLTDDGVVYASIPNVAYYEVSWGLIWKGLFKYTDTGILDRTHLRFFTRPSIEELFEQAGLSIKRIEGAMGARTRLFNRLTLRKFEHLLVGQYFIEAVKRG